MIKIFYNERIDDFLNYEKNISQQISSIEKVNDINSYVRKLENIIKNYYSKSDLLFHIKKENVNGYLCISNKRLMFVCDKKIKKPLIQTKLNIRLAVYDSLAEFMKILHSSTRI